MSANELILIGGGGHCRAAIDVIRTQGVHTILGILDQPARIGERMLNVECIGGDENIPHYVQRGSHFLVTVGQVGLSTLRKELYEKVMRAGGMPGTIISPKAHIADEATLGPGTLVGHFALVNSGTRVGANAIINSGAIVEHDCSIDDHVHVATGAVVNGDCIVGSGSFIGSGAVIRQGIRIGERCVVGAGAVVLKDVMDGATVVGVPATRRAR
ncbi:MAG: acetyltransferase [Flavobacteriales bacterium]|nr:acetyltransferase [Flavobacteriales bacterium]